MDYLVTDPARTIALRSLAEDPWHLAAGPILDLRRTFIETFDWALYRAGATLHELRKSCKKRRYLLEFFQSPYPREPLRTMIEQRQGPARQPGRLSGPGGAGRPPA